MDESFLKFNNKSEIIELYQKLLQQEYLLDEILQEIATLERGKVRPHETLKRAQVGSYVSSCIQQINNYLFKKKSTLKENVRKDLKRLAFKADKVLRENIVLQTTPPLDVIPFKHVPIRHSYSTYGGREQRWGYALHKNPFNEEGHSVTVANMPPQYIQSIHNHTLSEYCLIMDARTEGIYYPGKKREKIYTTKRSQILHFSATTPHTLKNVSKKYSRNITFKQSRGLLDWRPITNLNPTKIIRARVLKGTLNKIDEQITQKKFAIKDKYYDYTLSILRLRKGTIYDNKHSFDQYYFVINGILQIQHKKIVKIAHKNDFIVIDKNTPYTITTKTNCRLYTIDSLE